MPPAVKLTFLDDKPAKECSGCGIIKPLHDFHNSAIGSFFKNTFCKECINKKNRDKYKENKDNILERSREKRLGKYGITQADYERIYNEQNGNCVICHNHFDVLSVDHCHEKNKVRGLLCPHCNFGIGHFKNNIQLLENAIQYLKKSETE